MKLRAPSLYLQVVVAIALGAALGVWKPALAVEMKPLGDGFIGLIKILIAPIVFTTVAVGIARAGEAKAVGRIALKAFVYFEAVSTLALVVGLVVVNLCRPGAGLHASVAALDTSQVGQYAHGAAGPVADKPAWLALLDVFDLSGKVLWILGVALVVGFALLLRAERERRAVGWLDRAAHVAFVAVKWVMHLAPIGAFGAMAFTVGKLGVHALVSVGELIAGVYATSILFVVVVLGAIARVCGFSIVRFLRYIREELLVVLGTSSSETVLPRMMEKMERLGAAKPVVGLVIPTGYSFNLDGTAIYMTMGAFFVAQALDLRLTPMQVLTVLGVALLTSKGAAGVTGSGLVTLAATIAATKVIPVEGIALLIGIDRFLSECRALTNLVGNGVATLAIARWDGALDRAKLEAELGVGVS